MSQKRSCRHVSLVVGAEDKMKYPPQGEIPVGEIATEDRPGSRDPSEPAPQARCSNEPSTRSHSVLVYLTLRVLRPLGGCHFVILNHSLEPANRTIVFTWCGFDH